MKDNAHEDVTDSLSLFRTITLGAILVAVFAGAIMGVCIVLAAIGAALTFSGAVSYEQLTAPSTIAPVVFIVCILLAVIVCVATNYSLVRPMRRMTLAMDHLAKGDFFYRMEKKDRINLREVGEFAHSFHVAAEELASTEMMRAGFISDFSHEFRTPINSLSGFAQLLMEDDLTDEERREYAGIIVEESKRLSGLSERILLLSKMEAAAMLPSIEEVDVAEQLKRTVMLLEPKLEEKDIRIDLNLDACTVSGNADYLAQLWLNLLDNAVKFSPHGGRVSLALYGGRTGEEGRTASADEAVIWISDEGCGMDSATMAHIFDRFYQGDSSHASKGSGLGLALCKRIAELHGGTVDVQSAPGKGAVFEVRLPICATETRAR